MTKGSKYLTAEFVSGILCVCSARGSKALCVAAGIAGIVFMFMFFNEERKEHKQEKKRTVRRRYERTDEFAHLARRATFLENMKEIEGREAYAGRKGQAVDTSKENVLCV